MYAWWKAGGPGPSSCRRCLSDQPVSVLGKQLGQVRKAMEDLGYDNQRSDADVHVYIMSSGIPKTEADGFRAVRGEDPGETGL